LDRAGGRRAHDRAHGHGHGHGRVRDHDHDRDPATSL
jgi:hypothetical protein